MMKKTNPVSIRYYLTVVLLILVIISMLNPFTTVYAETGAETETSAGIEGETEPSSGDDEIMEDPSGSNADTYANEEQDHPEESNDAETVSRKEEKAEEKSSDAIESADENPASDAGSEPSEEKSEDEIAAAVGSGYKDGVYEGTGSGRNGDIVVSVTIENGRIVQIEIVSQNETPGFWATLFTENGGNKVTDSIIDAQSTEVDSVSGATLSSEGIKDAVDNALKKASSSISGEGTENDPYILNNADQLQQFAARIDEGDADYINSSVNLGSDIDLAGIDWNPIGAEEKTSNAAGKLFNGSFNGNNHVIKGLSIDITSEEEANAGLFSSLGSDARITDVRLEDVSISIRNTGEGASRAGGIAGDTARLSDESRERAAIVDGCTVKGRITVISDNGQAFAGGILGRAFSKSAVINCVSHTETKALTAGSYNAAYAGGIAGQTGAATVLANCASAGKADAENVSGSSDAYAGGLAGMLSSKTYSSYSLCDVTIVQKTGVTGQYAGALAGQLTASASGSGNYYSEEAAVIVSDDSGNSEKTETRAWPSDDSTGQTSAEISSEDMTSESFAEILNANAGNIVRALDEPELAIREWKAENGMVVTSDTVWQPGEIESGIFAGGSGLQEDPYIIENTDQLIAFAGSLSSKIDYRDRYIRLDSDLDLSGRNWSPVGGSFYRFDGDFDGNGKTIAGLTEGSTGAPLELGGDNSYIGLFGWINEHARIHDLKVEVSINTHSTGSVYIGGITGRMNGTDTEGDYHGAAIDNCEVRGEIRHVTDKGTSFVGGIVGHMFKGTVINSMTDVTVSGTELSGELVEIGGIAGLLNRGMIANCYALGDLTGSGFRDTQYDIEGMACIGNIAAVDGGTIVNCYGQGGAEALEYSIDTGIIAGWVTGIGKAYNCWYNKDARMVIDGRTVSPVDPFGETVAGGVSDEWFFRFPGSLTDKISGYHPDTDAQIVADGLNASFGSFPIDIAGVYGLSNDALKNWTVENGQAVLGDENQTITYVQPEIEKNIQEEPESALLDGTWYGRSNDKACIVTITVKDGEIRNTEVLKGESSGEIFDEAVARAKFKARFGDTSDYEPADTSKFRGSGTAGDPYRIENEEQLRYLAASVNEDVDWAGTYFRQTSNIAVSGEEWKPIGWGIFGDADGDGFGQDVVALYPFKGIYDGDNYTVSGMRAGTGEHPVKGNYMGMFGIIQGSYTDNNIPDDGYCSVLKNIRIEDVSFCTENRWRSYSGGLVGNAQGGFKIDNCSVTGVIKARSAEDFAIGGGMTGSLMYGSVTDSWTDTDTSSWSGKNYSYAGGMSGTTNRATIVNSYTLGDTYSDADQTNRAEAGGFVALDGGTCINCYARGNTEIVSKYSMYLGGFVGMAASSSEHRQCYYNTDADQIVAGAPVNEKRYAGKFVNASAEANAQAQTASVMSSEEFRTILENNRRAVPETVSQVRETLGADENGSSQYHSVYYNGNGSDLNPWILSGGIVRFRMDDAGEGKVTALEEEVLTSAEKLSAMSVLIAQLLRSDPPESDYTAASYNKYMQAKNAAIDVLSDTDASAEDIRAAAAELEGARNSLIRKKMNKITGTVTIRNTIANSSRKTNDVIWDKSGVKGATGYQVSWRTKGASKWASRNVGNVSRGQTAGLSIGGLYEIRVRPYSAATENSDVVYGEWSKSVYRYFHTTQKIRLRSGSKGSFTMSWAKDANATGYQVLFTTNKNGSGAANNINTVGKNSTSFTKKGLKSGTTYYVQVREIKKSGNITYIGNISSPVAVKVK